MLASTAEIGVSVNDSTLVQILTWTADGVKTFGGFSGTGEGNAEFRLFINGNYAISRNITESSPNADFIDVPYIPSVGTVIALKVYHQLGTAKHFVGCFLGS